MIYLDHAATTPVKQAVLDAMLPYFGEKFANGSGAYASGRGAKHAIDAARRQVASAIGAQPGEVYFTSGGTESDNWALFGCARANPQKKHLIVSSVEHHAVLNSCKALEGFGYDVTYLPVDCCGRVSAQAVRQAIRHDTLLVSVMLANNEVGTIEPVAEIAEIAHRCGALLHTDAVQAVGHISVDVNALQADLLSMSAHKFSGPKGAGALYISRGTRIDNLLYGGSQEKSMRAGTENVPAIVGMGKALELAIENMAEVSRRVSALRDHLQQELAQIQGVRINADIHDRLPGHLHISIDSTDTQMLLARLDMAGIAVSAGSACASGAVERSHVIKAMGIADENQADVRFTIGEDNTEDEILTTVQALRRILKR